jgi:uncharacterized protein YcbX
VTEILELWRYPVKSMQGERLAEAEVAANGVVGDRHWALVDRETGKALTARRQPELLYARARCVDLDAVEIALPDGTVAEDDDALSRWLGHPVALRRAEPATVGTFEIALDFEHEDTAEWFSWDGPAGSFHDSGRTQVSIIGADSLGAWDVRRFRPNVLVDGSPEAGWVGAAVASGDVALDVVKHIDRCVITTRPQPDGIERDLDVLRTVLRDRAGNLGVGALVQSAGTLRVGDPIGPAAG